MDVKAQLLEIFKRYEITEASISTLPDIIDDLDDLIERIVDANVEAQPDNCPRERCGLR